MNTRLDLKEGIMSKASKNKLKKDDLRVKSTDELEKLLKKDYEEWWKLKIDLKIGKLKDVHAASKKRKEIARIKTILKEKEIK